jgi:hypothetical protein
VQAVRGSVVCAERVRGWVVRMYLVVCLDVELDLLAGEGSYSTTLLASIPRSQLRTTQRT